jgi:3-methyladenine DNA glycosylase/8-oxoguanine DNA glycosylase
MRSAGVVERTFRADGPLDVRLSLGRSARPLTTLVRPEGVWRATRTPEGPATVLYDGRGVAVRVRAWGPGAAWAVDGAPRHVGAEDAGAADFDPPDGLLRRLHRTHRGLRITRTEAVFEALLHTILEQKVVGLEARRSYRGLVRRFGETPPGPTAVLPVQLRLAPAPDVLAATPAWAFHRFGVEAKRADTIRLAARHAARLEECSSLPSASASERLQTLPGIGPWSAAEVAVVALGDADAVSVGDYHLPNLVAWRLAGEARADDARMLELLEPYAGHRARVIRLLELDGVRAPRYGPRMPLRDIAAS